LDRFWATKIGEFLQNISSQKRRFFHYIFPIFQNYNIDPPPPPGLEDWTETDVLTQVIAASQQEYLDSLKKKQQLQKGESGQESRSGQDNAEPASEQKSEQDQDPAKPEN
jgi:hypothetical protein